MALWPKVPSIVNPPAYEKRSDWHGSYTIPLGELIECGWLDWSEDSWNWSNFAFNAETYERLTTAFNERFFDQEICITPPGVWKRKLLYKIKYELCPKYNRMYAMEEEKYCFDTVTTSDESSEASTIGTETFTEQEKRDDYGKSRNIESSFPETLLSGNSDYASTGQDSEHETIAENSKTRSESNDSQNISSNQKTTTEKFKASDFVYLSERFATLNGIDQRFLDDLQIMFASLWSVSTNGL